MKIEVTGHKGLGSLLEQLGRKVHEEGKYDPLFLIKDHPEVADAVKSANERRTFLLKEIEAIDNRIDEMRKELWAKIEDYMKNNNLWPAGVSHDADLCFRLNDGVVSLHRHED